MPAATWKTPHKLTVGFSFKAEFSVCDVSNVSHVSYLSCHVYKVWQFKAPPFTVLQKVQQAPWKVSTWDDNHPANSTGRKNDRTCFRFPLLSNHSLLKIISESCCYRKIFNNNRLELPSPTWRLSKASLKRFIPHIWKQLIKNVRWFIY